jgi:hypothetical protein
MRYDIAEHFSARGTSMPLQIKDIIDLQTLVESEQIEFKLAGGKDGKGELPKDFWPTYSAMANGRGGWVILGVKEQAGEFTSVGVVDPEKIKTDLFNQLNDRDRVSVNVLRSENDVQLVSLQGKDVWRSISHRRCVNKSRFT